jgi:hypothetical protein
MAIRKPVFVSEVESEAIAEQAANGGHLFKITRASGKVYFAVAKSSVPAVAAVSIRAEDVVHRLDGRKKKTDAEKFRAKVEKMTPEEKEALLALLA